MGAQKIAIFLAATVRLLPAMLSSSRNYLDKMTMTTAHYLHNVDASTSTSFEVNGVPDVTGKVCGCLAWMQVPKAGGGEMGLGLI